MPDSRLSILQPVIDRAALDGLAIVPGSNFRRIFAAGFHQNERPLVVLVRRDGHCAAIVPNLELASFNALDFKGEAFDWRDEAGYDAAFDAAASHFGPVASLGVEGQTMRVFVQMALHKAMPGTKISDAHSAISSIRLLKQDWEIERMRRAISISEAALEQTLAEVRIGLTETNIEAILLGHLFAQGCEGLAFEPIVAAGENSAMPHAKARPDYRIKAGDALLFDFGAAFGGYCADITRTFFVGEVAGDDRDFYETVRAANKAGRAASRPGATAHEVDDAVQNVLEASPFARFARHKTGHGLGLDVHEDPYIMRGNPMMLESGMVFTVEPGLYRPGECGMRIEDDVLITPDGARCLTSFPRELRIVG